MVAEQSGKPVVDLLARGIERERPPVVVDGALALARVAQCRREQSVGRRVGVEFERQLAIRSSIFGPPRHPGWGESLPGVAFGQARGILSK